MRGLNFPAGKVHIITIVVFISTDVEVQLHFLANFIVIEQATAILDDLELEVLGIFVVLGGDHKLPLAEAAGEGLGLIDQLDGSTCFV